MRTIISDIDVGFDFRSDTPPGADPDAASPSLRRHHQILWSKPLPSGESFELSAQVPRVYLHHRSALGEFSLSSDCVVPTFTRSDRIADVVSRIPREVRDEFNRLGYTIGGMMVFPANKVNRKMTINGARGCHPRIKDRFDLTVECIRLHYDGTPSPLSDVLLRYGDFFGLFQSFEGYVDFFLLQDLVDGKSGRVRFFLPFEGFNPWPLPTTVTAYERYRANAVEFLAARNERIASWANSQRR